LCWPKDYPGKTLTINELDVHSGFDPFYSKYCLGKKPAKVLIKYDVERLLMFVFAIFSILLGKAYKKANK
jgi:hypothetical protein